jgi:predicted site-specific integrase-resolvase
MNTYKKRLVKIGEAARMLGTTPATLRLWERTKEVLPARKTAGGTRYYDIESLQLPDSMLESAVCCAVCYAASDKDSEVLKEYCVANGWEHKVVTGYEGSYDLLRLVLKNEVRRLVVLSRDELIKIGSEAIFDICKLQGIHIFVIHE